ncbi:DUF4864 domain-containing protein [Aliiroseovarius sp. 2305UL8-7]|uniref:DUF4864 domain-containing protein n=1 Tax=Aliiroseovarius conchicola TaxID=3121637 RepID=UPI00352924EE
MRFFIITLGLIGLLSFSAQAQDKSVESVISGQIEAFGSDDVATAFTFASPNIQRMFGTPENFGKMVQGAYPMVWRPAEITFLDQVRDGIVIWQRLHILDQQNTDHWFAYQMVKINGEWKINGVFRIDAPGLSA